MREVSMINKIQRAPYPYGGYYYITVVNNKWKAVILDGRRNYVDETKSYEKYGEVCEELTEYYQI